MLFFDCVKNQHIVFLSGLDVWVFCAFGLLKALRLPLLQLRVHADA